MIFSVFGLLVPNGLFMRGGATAFEWVMAGFGAAAFVALSAMAVYSWQRHRPFLWAVVLLVALGFAYTPMTFAGTIFFALAAHMLPWALGGNILRTAIHGTLLVAVVLAGYVIMPEYGIRWINASLYYALTIAGQVWVVRLCVNLRRLAAGAERRSPHIRGAGNRRRFGQRQVQGHRGADTKGGVDFDEAVRLPHEPIDHGQPQPGPAPGFLGSEERLENPGHDLRIDPRPLVRHREGDVAARPGVGIAGGARFVDIRRRGADGQAAAAFHGVAAVDGEIDQRLE